MLRGNAMRTAAAKRVRRSMLTSIALESRRIAILRLDRTIHMLHGQLADGTLDLGRPFRPGLVWSPAVQARLVESVLLRLPLLPIHVVEDREGDVRIIDGLQRLRSLFAFLDGELVLTELHLLPELEEKRFADLPVRLRRRFEDSILTVMILGSDTDPELLPEIFNRLNAWAPLRDDEIP
jgi:hypothetical protein